jgi:hypothetical protein
MDPLSETSIFTSLAPQLLSAKILEICAGVLLVLFLLAFIFGWVRHLSWYVRLYALVPLTAGMASAIAAHALHDTYVYWVYGLYAASGAGPAPQAYYERLQRDIASANQAATVLGWSGIIVTVILLALGLVGLWRLVGPRRRRHLQASLVIES